MSILHTETLRNPSKLCKAQTLIQMQGMAVGCNYGIELKDVETKFCTDFQGVFHQLFTDLFLALPEQPIPDGGNLIAVVKRCHVLHTLA